VLAVIGGTGALGSGLVRRWADVGFSLVVGSRDIKRAEEFVADAEIADGGMRPRGATIADAVSAANIIILTVPYSAQTEVAQTIRKHAAGKLVIDTTVPLMPPRLAHVQLPSSDSAAVSLRELLSEDTRVVSAFHNIPARKLKMDFPIDCDVLVFGDDPSDRQIVISLAELGGMRGVHGGALVNSTAAEALTSVLISIGQFYKIDGAGFRITGLE